MPELELPPYTDEVLEAVYEKNYRRFSREDSLAITLSAIAAYVASGKPYTFAILVKTAHAEHRGTMLRERQGKWTHQRSPRQYEGEIEEVPSPSKGATSEKASAEIRAVQKALNGLKENDAEVLARRYMDSTRPKLKDLAEDMNLTVGALKMRLGRATEKFKDIYNDDVN